MERMLLVREKSLPLEVFCDDREAPLLDLLMPSFLFVGHAMNPAWRSDGGVTVNGDNGASGAIRACDIDGSSRNIAFNCSAMIILVDFIAAAVSCNCSLGKNNNEVNEEADAQASERTKAILCIIIF